MSTSRRYSQFELFPDTQGKSAEPSGRASLIKDLTLSLENIIVLCILLLMFMVLSFSFGVERGKIWTAKSDKKEEVVELNKKRM